MKFLLSFLALAVSVVAADFTRVDLGSSVTFQGQSFNVANVRIQDGTTPTLAAGYVFRPAKEVQPGTEVLAYRNVDVIGIIYEPTGAGLFQGDLTASGTTSDRWSIVSTNAGYNGGLLLQRSNSRRWAIYMDTAAESGSNASSNLQIARYDDSNAFLGAAVAINRKTGDISISGALTTSSGRILKRSSITGNTTLDGTYHIVFCSGTFTVTLPAVASNDGREYRIKNTSTGTITIDGNASETIDGNATVSLGALESVSIVCDGAAWWVV